MLRPGDIRSSSNGSQVCVHHLKKIIDRYIYPLVNQARYINISFNSNLHSSRFNPYIGFFESFEKYKIIGPRPDILTPYGNVRAGNLPSTPHACTT